MYYYLFIICFIINKKNRNNKEIKLKKIEIFIVKLYKK